MACTPPPAWVGGLKILEKSSLFGGQKCYFGGGGGSYFVLGGGGGLHKFEVKNKIA